MRTVRRLFYADIFTSVSFVGLAFLSLFYFIDFVDELGSVGKGGFTAVHAALLALMDLPWHLYDLMPIVVLIGCIYSLSRMAQSSEFTILRTGGLGPVRALGLLATLALVFVAATFVIGDYVVPFGESQGTLLRAKFRGGLKIARAGAWLKDHRQTADGERSYAINVGRATADGELQAIRIFAFDGEGRLVERISAERGHVDADSTWQLAQVRRTAWPVQTAASAPAGRAAALPTVNDQQLPSYSWASALPTQVVTAALLPLETMSTLELLRYINHLDRNEQAVQQYQIQFWKRAIYPFACLVMVALALPFAYLHARAGGISIKVFGGIMLGISFVLLNNVAGHLGLLRDWTPWLVATVPSAIYLLLSMGAFAWLVRYR
jgi:lipopolysaccharide export system permease protein